MPELGTQFAGYRIEGVVGRGGMGVVYRATELALDRPVALKLIAPELAGDDSFRERFLRESRLAASIDHAGILPVYAAGEADGELFLATRFVPGTDLRSLIEDGQLPPQRAIGLVGQVADALDAAHERGLVHRDVKPGNVLVDTADHCYLCDFGLTTQLVDGGTTATGRLAGSLDYLAPEQIRRGEVDGRADQYALACVLYELLSGTPPFRRETEAQTLWAHMQEEPAPLLAYDELDPVFARAFAKEPEERYEDCNAFADDARAALGLGPSPIAVRRRRRRIGGRLLALGGALLAVAVVAVVLALTLRSGGTLEATPNSVGAVDPVSLELTSVTSVGNTPTDVAASDDWVWVINSNDGAGTISRIDPRTRRLVIDLLGRGDAAYDRCGVRLPLDRNHGGSSSSRRVGHGSRRVELDASERRRNHRVRLRRRRRVARGGAERDLGRQQSRALAHRSVDRAAATAGESDLGADGVRVRLALGARPRARACVPASGKVIGTVDLVGSSADVATGFGSVWIADDEMQAIVRVDERQEAVVRTYDVGGSPLGVAVGADAVWAASDDGTVVRVDPDTDDVTVVRVGGAPRVVDVGAGRVWVSVD